MAGNRDRIQRMTEEYFELSERVDNLWVFLDANPDGSALINPHERPLMVDQLDSMQAYRRHLAARFVVFYENVI